MFAQAFKHVYLPPCPCNTNKVKGLSEDLRGDREKGERRGAERKKTEEEEEEGEES